ncbi:MAG: RNA-guided endonuclease TnpB family protein [Candidatus Bipolaricaulia bacterium]
MLKAQSVFKSYLALRRQGRDAERPTFSENLPMLIRQDLYRLVQNENGTWFVKLPGRMVIPLVLSHWHHERLSMLYGGSARQGSAELSCQAGTWWLTMSLVIDKPQVEPQGVLGVDLGVVKHAVCATTDGQINLFFNGRPARWRKERWSERRSALQANGRRARMKREQGREQRWMKTVNHLISRRIVDAAKTHGCAIALENITGIRERARGSRRFNRMMASWAFKQLTSFIEYKARLAGVPAVWVNPESSSRTCPQCGFNSKSNRRGWSWFCCKDCGYQSDPDRVAAMNLAQRGSMSLGQAPDEERSVIPVKAPGSDELSSGYKPTSFASDVGSPRL